MFAVGNSRALNRLGHIGAHDWNLLMGIVTGSLSLLLIPWSLAFDGEPHAMLDWARLAGVSMGVALLASILGNLLWNRMSRLLPLTLVGQMILFETLFALLYGFLWEARLPTGLEAAAFVLVVASVLSCIAAHRSRRRPKRSSRPDRSGRAGAARARRAAPLSNGPGDPNLAAEPPIQRRAG